MSTAYVAPGPLTPILTNGWGEDRSWTLDSYRARGGYQGLEKARTMEPAEIVQVVKDSGLRGRGGAGFPTGLKWSFLPPADGGPRYLVVNADESEPGTCKDIPLIMGNPHVLIEGIAITSRAIGCDHAFVYLRGEVTHVYRRLLQAVREATESGVLGDLRWSAEGRSHGVHVDGLLVPFTLSKWRRRRLIGPVIGWLHGAFRLGSVQQRIDSVDANRTRQVDELDSILSAATSELHGRIARLESTLGDGERAKKRQHEFERSLDPLYVEFEKAFRGPIELIRERAMPYIDILKQAGVGGVQAPVLDLGCGGGDWLSLLSEHGMVGTGIDSYTTFLERCRSRGLKVIEGDVLEEIRKLPDSSFGAVTGMHIAEHLPFTVLIELLDECARVLIPGGVIALETPNPENLQVAALHFYNDPTHRNPLPPQTLEWLVGARGFGDVEIKRWTIARELYVPEFVADDVPGAIAINFLLQQQRNALDYAVIGRRA